MAADEANITIKRVYEPPAPDDGIRILVDRLWPRGVAKDAAALAAWMPGLGPSTALRTWFGHQAERWETFAESYRHELKTPVRQMFLAEIQRVAVGATVTLVYGARDRAFNGAVVLRDYLRQPPVHPHSSLSTADQVLLTVAAVAAAQRDGVAARAVVQQLVGTLVSRDELSAALHLLVAQGSLGAEADGWCVKPQGQRTLHQLTEDA